jgi:hypothetical protein
VVRVIRWVTTSAGDIRFGIAAKYRWEPREVSLKGGMIDVPLENTAPAPRAPGTAPAGAVPGDVKQTSDLYFLCPIKGCGKRIHAPVRLAGAKAKCPRCGTIIRVPAS